MSRATEQARKFMRDNIVGPDRRSTIEWAEQEKISLPGSLRSERFRIEIAPWLRLPFQFSDDPEVRSIITLAAVQSAKTAFGLVTMLRKLATDPGSMLYNWENDLKAAAEWNERAEKTVRQAAVLRHRMPPPNIKQVAQTIKFRDGMYLRMQGSNSDANRQSKSVRYLWNEEAKDWKPGHLTDMRKRITAAWNSLEINITPASVGGITDGKKNGDEVFWIWEESSQHVFHMVCPCCGKAQIPRFRTEIGKPGGLHICDPADGKALDLCKPAEHVYNYAQIARHIYYECEAVGCGHRWRDTPSEREQIANSTAGEHGYIQMNPSAMKENKGCKWNALIVPWIPWVGLMKEFHNALSAMRYGDIELYKDFVQKREVEFFSANPDDLPMESTLVINEAIKKSRDGMPDRMYRFMMVDKQRGSARKGESPHYWCVIRDWKKGASSLVFEGKVPTDEDLENIRMEHGVNPLMVAVDSGDGMTTIDVYRMCARFGYIAIKGEDRASYSHTDPTKPDGRIMRRFSPDQNAIVTGTDGVQYPVPLILYSKQGIRDALFYLQSSADFDFQIPGDVGTDYKSHMESEKLVDWHIPKTGQRVKIWKQIKKRNDLFVCECYQALFADMLGIIGAVPIEQRPEITTEPSRG